MSEANPTTAPAVQNLLDWAGELWASALSRHLDPGDEALQSVNMVPLPTDDGFEPALWLYVMLRPAGETDGMHMGQFLSPYLLDADALEFIVGPWATDTAPARQRLREARHGGAQPNLGLVPGTSMP